MRLYLNEYPRTFVVAHGAYALICRHPYPTRKLHPHLHTHSSSADTPPKNISSKVIVEFDRLDLIDLSHYKEITPKAKLVHGFLGFLNVKSNIYLGFITHTNTVASPTVHEKIKQVTGVEFYCLNSDEFDHLFHYREDMTQERITTEYPAASVTKLLSLGAFYYSDDFDITSNMQERGTMDLQHHFKLSADTPYFRRYMWNSFMISELMDFRNRLTPYEQFLFDKTGFLTIIARGYAQTVNTVIREGEDALLTLISKQLCSKSGPLFGDWGCDDNGSVSNFVETEVIIYTENFCFSYVIVRGNAPIFWEIENHFSKKTILTPKTNKKIVFPRSFDASQNAFGRHFEQLTNQFGEAHLINALSQDSKTYKGLLNENFKEHLNFYNKDAVTKLQSTDLPISTSSMKKAGYTSSSPHDIVSRLVDPIIDFGAMFYDIKKQDFKGKQLGVFRITSFDSLSKANYISKIIAQEVIELAFRDIGVQVDHDLFLKHAKLWAENDDNLSRITLNFLSYSTKLQSSSASSTKQSVKSHFTKKYLSGVVDPKANETAMLKLLGRLQDQISVTLHNPIHDYVSRELNTHSKEFSSFKDIRVFASTFNVNGQCVDEHITDWLFPPAHNINKSYDLVFIGFQEIVELKAGQMVNTDYSNRLFWEKSIKAALDKANPENFKYVSLWSGQIGGIALLLLVKESDVQHVTRLESAFKKTGFGGVSANKGGVAVSFSYANTQICLVSAHMAAGLSNVDERHHNYKTIAKGIKFSKNRRIKDHDAVIWLGDFNYRIGLPNEQVKPLIEQKKFGKLFEFDQLNIQMKNGESFPFFDEMEIQFPPTYKFDNGTSIYDTSEKQRIPAWTDRILNMSRSKIVKQLLYDSADGITFSDHRPVLAIFSVSVNIINETVKENLLLELYDSYKKRIGDINDIFINNNNISFLLDDVDDSTLPAPSSDTYKWWLDGRQPAKISIPELNNPENIHDGDLRVINPRYPVNPFEDTNEKEFISKSELLEMLQAQS